MSATPDAPVQAIDVAAYQSAAQTSGLVEHDAPIVVESAPLFASAASAAHGSGHEVAVEVQESMERHATQLRRSSSVLGVSPSGLPRTNFAAASSGMAVVYNSGYSAPSSVRAVIDAAVNQWDSVLATNPSGPIVVEVFWTELESASLLGYAGPDGMYSGGGLPSSLLYTSALTNTLLGTDANGPSRAEIQVVLNSSLLTNNRWYLGTSGTPPSSQIDLYSVVLHEVGHGLGFLGSASTSSGQSSPSLYQVPYSYDAIASHNGTAMPDVANQTSALVSGDLQIKISAGNTYELFAPTSWSQGSSFSHFDEQSYPSGSPGALMTPMLGSGETARVLDSATLGLMASTGWPVAVSATTPTITSLSPSLTSVIASWNQNLGQVGVAPDAYIIEAWKDGTTLQSSVTVAGSAATATIGSLTPGQNYVVKITPTGAGAYGASTTASVQLSSSGGPADPADWPSYIRDVPLDGQINRLYQAYFLRLADESGFAYWVDQRARWTPLVDISGAFATSPEFQNRYGSLSNEAFVDLVYANVLNRLADTEGRAYWIGQLNQGLDRGTVMIGFAESSEYVNRTGTSPPTSVNEARISRLYQAFFLRAADAGGLAYWTSQADSGVSLEAIASAFAQSSEFQSRYGSLNSQQFIELVYGNVLNRAPDSGGLNYWVGLLNAGLDRGTAMVGFSESVEFIKSTGTIP